MFKINKYKKQLFNRTINICATSEEEANNILYSIKKDYKQKGELCLNTY